jgi:heme/copper-type cytochrome/quinol oxidase subunit 3
MILFIASEVMFFVGWFWAFFDFSLFPSDAVEVIGGKWPPKGIEAVMNPFLPDDPPVTEMQLWPQETGGNGMFIAAWRKT